MSKRHSSHLFSFSAGLVVGLVSISISIIFKVFAGGLFLPELASQTLFSLTPGEFESQAIETLGPLAKYSTFIASIIVTTIIFGIFGIILDKLFYKFNLLNQYILKAISSFTLTYGTLVIISFILVTIIQLRSGSQTISIPFVILSLIPSQIAAGLIFPLFLRKSKDKGERQPYPPQQQKITENTKEEHYNRRDFIRLVLASVVSIPIIYFGLNRLFSPLQDIEQQQQQQQQQIQSNISNLLRSQSQQQRSIPAEFKDPALAPLLGSEITPTYLFYRIDINPIVPEVAVNSWNLQVKGMVDNPLKLSYEEIRSMPAIEEFVTLECISNKIGGDLTGTALWKGVPLKDILQKAKIASSVKYIVFRCSDGYDVGIPLDKGLMEETILAYEMNLAPLTSKHGFPLRAIVPGLYGMMNPKWITEIELVDKVLYEGYWQRNGWTNIAEYNTGSSIVIPGQAPIRHRFRGLDEIPSSYSSNGRVPIAGIAFGGNRGISKVEVSTDGGKTWKTAKIKEPLSQYTWVLWTAGFIPKERVGNYKIVVRATDKKGQVQISELRKPFPDGATGYHTISV